MKKYGERRGEVQILAFLTSVPIGDGTVDFISQRSRVTYWT
jgi:hypothetical protein